MVKKSVAPVEKFAAAWSKSGCGCQKISQVRQKIKGDGQKTSRGMLKKLVTAVKNLIAAIEKLVESVAAWSKNKSRWWISRGMVEALVEAWSKTSRSGRKIGSGGRKINCGGRRKTSRGLVEKFVAAVEIVTAWSKKNICGGRNLVAAWSKN